MRLTLHSDYALRVLIQVGLGGGKLTTISDIANSFGISRHHLMKVVNDLGQKGYLDTVRGRHGGMRLMREPRDINVGQVVRDTEDNLSRHRLPGAAAIAASSAPACCAASCAKRPRRSWRCSTRTRLPI